MTKSRLQEIALFAVIAFLSGILGGFLINLNSFDSSDSLGNPDSQKVQQETVKEIISENAIIDVAESYHDSVVSVVGEKELEVIKQDPRSFFFNFNNDPFFQQFFGTPQQTPDSSDQQPESTKKKQEIGAGSGFVISADGKLLTNKHVVSDTEAEYKVVFADGTEYDAEVVSRDPTNDLAVLKIKSEDGKKFQPVKFVSNYENVKVGQQVVAIGNALGEFDNSLTSGIISASGRSITAGDGRGMSEQLNQLLQTDAAINPGNSGGPLVNLRGEVVGMNTAIASGEGIGFAIPLDNAKVQKILKQIEEYGKIVKPYLGVRYQLVTPEMNQELKLGSDSGAWLKGENDLPAVIADTPASEAGLKGGDIILEVDGKKVDKDNPLAEILNNYSPDDEVEMKILRDGREQTLKVTLGEWDDESDQS